MIEIPIRAETKAEYERLRLSQVIERPLNRYWRRFLPPQMFVIGENVAMIIEPVVLSVYWKGRKSVYRTLCSVIQTYVYRDEKKIVFFLRKPVS